MIRTKRIDHVAMGHHDYRAQMARLHRLLGFRPLRHFPERPGFSFIGGTGQVQGTPIEFEVIEPTTDDSFLRRFLDEEGPGLHHVAAKVDDLEETVAEIERLGLTPFGGIAEDSSWRFTFLHPKESGGVLWQLFVPIGPEQEVDRSSDSGVVDLVRIDHVSLATRDIAWQIAFQERVLGFKLLKEWEDTELGYKGGVMSIPGSPLQFEMMQAARPDSHIQKFIERRHPGLHHVCCEVADVDRAVAALRAEGIEPHGGVIENGWRKHTFLHPRDSGGVLFQLFEEPREAPLEE